MAVRDRDRKPYEHRFGNTPIMFGGVQIGMMIARVPWLVPTAFEGAGLPLNTLSKVPKGSIAATEKKGVVSQAVAPRGLGVQQPRRVPGKTSKA